jgi:hypothetical protein
MFFPAARARAEGREEDCEVDAKMRGKRRFMRGLQPGRQPQATPTPDSTDMIMKVDAPCPGEVVLGGCLFGWRRGGGLTEYVVGCEVQVCVV